MANLNFKTIIILASGLFLGNIAFAQQSDNTQNTNLVKPFDPDSSFRTWSIGFNAGILSQYTVFLGRADFKTPVQEIGYGLYVKKQFVPFFGIQADFFAGNLQGQTAEGSPSPYQNYNTQINWSGALSVNFTLVNLSWRSNQSHLQLYSNLGGGMISYTPTVTDYAGISTTASSSAIMVPLGLGLKCSIARGINIDLGYQVNFVDAGNVDGYQYGGHNDRFAYSHIGLEFAIGKRSKPQLSGHNAGPGMRTEYLHGINNLQKQVINLKSKTDSIQQQLNSQAAQTARLEEMITSSANDSDGDGVADRFDKCPNTPAGTKVDGSGCPLALSGAVITTVDKRVASEALDSLQFDLKKSTIKPSAYDGLDKLAKLLISKKLRLKLDGYTDNTGPDWTNLALSKNRTKAIQTYLVKKGVKRAYIVAEGYGNSNPIESNETIEGRKKNRRVEFTLY